MDTKQVIQSQYLAALNMLKEVIVKCPQSVWDAAGDKFKFWSKSYHTLFYVHLYLQNAEKDLFDGKNTMTPMEISHSQRMKCSSICHL